jgi:hypothetical protein
MGATRASYGLGHVPGRGRTPTIIDFIIKLPKSKESGTDLKYDLIFIVIDKLIKYAYFILCREDMSAEDFIYLFNKYIIS